MILLVKVKLTSNLQKALMYSVILALIILTFEIETATNSDSCIDFLQHFKFTLFG